MERPLKEIKLPVSKMTAKIVEFFSRGEAKEIEARQWEGADFKYLGADVEITNIDPNHKQKRDDALLLFGVKEILDSKQSKVELNKEAFDNLPDRDVNLLLAELTIVYTGIEADKKKS